MLHCGGGRGELLCALRFWYILGLNVVGEDIWDFGRNFGSLLVRCFKGRIVER